MCGIFGYVSHDGLPVDVEILERVATVTMQRGPHAWGMAWIDGQGRLKMFKQSGKITNAIGLLAMASDARMLIGHCRYATQGDPANNLNNHPHPADGGWIVHNGMIRDYRQIIDDEELHPVTDCDSEVLGLLLEQSRGDLLTRCSEMMLRTAGSPVVLMGLWKPGVMLMTRRNNPLHVGTAKRWSYFGSLADGLPGRVSEIPEGTIQSYSFRKGEKPLVKRGKMPTPVVKRSCSPCEDRRVLTLWDGGEEKPTKSRPRFNYWD